MWCDVSYNHVRSTRNSNPLIQCEKKKEVGIILIVLFFGHGSQLCFGDDAHAEFLRLVIFSGWLIGVSH